MLVGFSGIVCGVISTPSQHGTLPTLQIPETDARVRGTTGKALTIMGKNQGPDGVAVAFGFTVLFRGQHLLQSRGDRTRGQIVEMKNADDEIVFRVVEFIRADIRSACDGQQLACRVQSSGQKLSLRVVSYLAINR